MSAEAIRRRIRAAARLFNRPERGAVILAYHRIADVALDPSGLAVSPQRFADQMAALVRLAEPVRLTELVAGRAYGRRGRTGVAVTFDDGYLDNLTIAMPILERFGIPATMFIPSDAIGRGTAFWWDELEALVFDADVLPDRLDIEVGGQRIVATVQDDGGLRDGTGRHRDWRVWNGPARTPRQRLYTLLWQRLRLLPVSGIEPALDALADWAGHDRRGRPRHPTMEVGDLRVLVAGGLADVGGHTVTHAPLPELSEDRQRDEIEANRRDLETLTGSGVRAFSYPYGNYSGQTAALVSEAGFEVAVTTEAAAVTARTDPLAMPRLGVEDWDGARFTVELTRLLPRI